MTDLHLHPALREPAQTSKAWPFEEARKLVKRYPDGKPGGEAMLFETGYGPSGLPHIGTFNEVLRTTMVRRAYEARTGGAFTRLVAFSDDMDGLRSEEHTSELQSLMRIAYAVFCGHKNRYKSKARLIQSNCDDKE